MRQIECDISDKGTAPEIKRLSHLLALRMWPGNVRELAARIEELWLISDNDLDFHPYSYSSRKKAYQ